MALKPTKERIEQLLEAGDIFSASKELGISTIALSILCKDRGIPWPEVDGKRPRRLKRKLIKTDSPCTQVEGAMDDREQASNEEMRSEIPTLDDHGRLNLNRSQLYDLIWSYPIVRLARRWAISDVGLAKACKRNRIPRPGLGYWAKRQHGYVVPKESLPEPESDWEIRIQGCSGTVCEGEAAEGADMPELKKNLKLLPKITTDNELDHSHPLMERTRSSMERCKPDHKGIKRPSVQRAFPIECSENSMDRALRIWGALNAVMESQGFTLNYGVEERSVRYEVFKQRSGWDISNENRKVSTLSVMILDEELRIALQEDSDSKKYDPKEFPHNDPSGRTWWSYPDYLYVPNGQLSLRILEEVNCRKSWRDGKIQRLESCLNSFLVGLVDAAVSKRNRRLMHEQQQREWTERQKRWEEEQRRRAQEEKRQKRIFQDISDWEKARRMGEYIQAVRERATNPLVEIAERGELDRWLRWAERLADAIDPLSKALPGFSSYGGGD